MGPKIDKLLTWIAYGWLAIVIGTMAMKWNWAHKDALFHIAWVPIVPLLRLRNILGLLIIILAALPGAAVLYVRDRLRAVRARSVGGV